MNANTELLAAPKRFNSDLSDDVSMVAPVRIGFIIIFLVFGVFGFWSAFAPIDGASLAPGTVIVKSNKKLIQHLEGGIVKDILVQNGDFINAGDPILVLDDTQSMAQLEILRSQNIALTVSEARLIAQRDNLAQINYPGSLQQSETNVREEISAQNQIFAARRTAMNGEKEVLEQRIEQLHSRLEGLRALKDSKEALAESYAEELSDIEALLGQGFSDKTKLRAAERSYEILKGEVAELAASISSTEVQIGETRLQILQGDYDFQNEVASELSETQTRLKDVNERVLALQDIVSRAVVRSPAAGILNGMQIHTIGGVIGPGTPIAEVVPQADELIIEARLPIIDIDRVAIGQDAIIRFSSFNSKAVPTVMGKVLSISADAIIDPNTGASYYLTRIEVTPDSLADLGSLTLVPGMPAEAFIATGSRTFLQYTFKPFTNAMARSFIDD